MQIVRHENLRGNNKEYIPREDSRRELGLNSVEYVCLFVHLII